MKTTGFYLVLMLYATLGNCRTIATSHNNVEDYKHLEELLEFIEFLAKELEEAVIAVVKDIEDCHPIMVDHHGISAFRMELGLSYDYSWETESCLWDILKKLVGKTFDTIKYILKEILGIKRSALAIQLMNSETHSGNQTVDDQMKSDKDGYHLLLMDKEYNEKMANRIEAVFKSVEISLHLMICYLHQENINHDKEQI